jgi:hypothetical protein
VAAVLALEERSARLEAGRLSFGGDAGGGFARDSVAVRIEGSDDVAGVVRKPNSHLFAFRLRRLARRICSELIIAGEDRSEMRSAPPAGEG